MVDLATGVDLDAYLHSLDRFGIRLGLDAMGRVCEALGHPERRFRSLIIAGTNGKGSVSAMTESVLRTAGHRTGRYTSPHLVRIEERVAIGGRPIAAADFREAVRHVQHAIDRLLADGRLTVQPTYFEVTTAAAFVAFQRAAVDVAVLEVGLGGRFDATNVVTPMAVAITSVDLDHQAQLGNTLSSIAREKAGVIKPGAVVILGERRPEVRELVRATCAERNADFVDAFARTSTVVDVGAHATTLSLTTPDRCYGRLALALAGRHQATNAVTAVRLLEELDRRGIRVPPRSVADGLRDTVWPGCLQWLPLPGGHALLDGAHNPAAARAVADYLTDTQQRPLPIVFAVMRDKDTTAMVEALAPHASTIVCTAVPHARARPAHELANRVRAHCPGLHVDTERAPLAALARAFRGDTRVCATGSIYLVGHLLAHLTRPQPVCDAEAQPSSG